MAIFAYKAMSSAGRIVLGRMDAVNVVDLELRLKRMELDLIDGSPVKSRSFFESRVPRRELINFCFHLEQLTSAGVPILEGLADLRDGTEVPRFREVLAGMIESIAGGSRLSQAMEEHPRIFDRVFCSLVKAGEDTGKLPDVLSSLFETMKWQDELAEHTKKLVMYPAFVGLIVIGVVFFMMIYLVPKMTSFIRNMGQVIPPQTRLLMFVSDVFVNYWYLILFLPVALIIGATLLVRHNPNARYLFDNLKLRAPLLGDILRKIILSRFASVFAMMYASGISVLETMRSTENIVGNVVMREGLQRAGQLIEEGENITTAFQNVGMFPPLVIRMLRVGENTGAIDAALKNVSYFYSRDVRESIERLQALVEPAMTLFVGAILGWVMISVLGPIYDIITKLKT